MSNEPLKVSDRYQPVKVVLMVVFLLGAVYVGWRIVTFLDGASVSKLGGIALNTPQYQTSTNAQVSCATSTSILGTQSGRTSFSASNGSAVGLFLCKAATCASTTGKYISPTSTGANSFEQSDGYVGPYSCIGESNNTSTLNTSYSQ